MLSMKDQIERDARLQQELVAWLVPRFRAATFERRFRLTHWTNQYRGINAEGAYFDVVTFETNWQVISDAIRSAPTSQVEWVEEVADQGNSKVIRRLMSVNEGRILVVQRRLPP